MGISSIWLMVWLVAVSFSATQLAHYVFPAYPPACIMIASLLVVCRRSSAVRDAWLYAAAGGLALGGAIISAAMLFGGRCLEFPVLSDFAWLGLIPLVCAALFAFAVRLRARVLGLQTVVLGALALQWAAFQIALPRFGKLDPAATMIVQADAIAGGSAALATWRYSAPGVIWHADRPVKVCRTAEEAAEFLRSAGSGAGFLLVPSEALEDLANAMRGRVDILAERRPLFRREALLLVRAR